MTIENFKRATNLMAKKETYERHLVHLENVLENYKGGRIKFEHSGWAPVDIQPPYETGIKFIQDTIAYYRGRIQYINHEMEAL